MAKLIYLQQHYSLHSEHTDFCPVDLIVTESAVSMRGAQSYDSIFFTGPVTGLLKFLGLRSQPSLFCHDAQTASFFVLCFQSILSCMIQPVYAFRTFWRRPSHRFWSHQQPASSRQTSTSTLALIQHPAPYKAFLCPFQIFIHFKPL